MNKLHAQSVFHLFRNISTLPTLGANIRGKFQNKLKKQWETDYSINKVKTRFLNLEILFLLFLRFVSQRFEHFFCQFHRVLNQHLGANQRLSSFPFFYYYYVNLKYDFFKQYESLFLGFLKDDLFYFFQIIFQYFFYFSYIFIVLCYSQLISTLWLV